MPILYSFKRCPYAMRARMALYLSQTVVELREVSLRNKPQPMIEISPKGTVPVLLLDDGSVIDEARRTSLSGNMMSLTGKPIMPT